MYFYLLLLLAGITAGFINTLAGGGSLLVLPILILSGVPSIQANATNRIAILLQNITGSYRFHVHKKLVIRPIWHIAVAAIIGAIIGSLFVSRLNSLLFDKILAILLIGILILMFKPHKKESRFTKQLPTWAEWFIFLLVGFYGGFIQVGVGFVLLATLNLIEAFDLVTANAVKVFIVMCYTVSAVIVFSISGAIIWKYGLTLAVGNVIGAYLGVNAAVKKGEKFIRLILILAVSLACLKLFGIIKF